jgi:cystinosin
LNWQRKSVVGLSFDFLALNFLGFICYSVYNVALLASPAVRAEYRRQMGGSPGVRLNDAIFAVHAALMTSAVS